jgi:hypothetical protein
LLTKTPPIHPNIGRLDFDPQKTGSQIYSELEHLSPAKTGSSALLHERGIPGIRYLDQGSRTPAALERRMIIARNDLRNAEKRGIGDPERIRAEIASIENQIRNHPITSNYVLFDDKIVDILRKYAIPGAAGAGTFGSIAPGGDQ